MVKKYLRASLILITGILFMGATIQELPQNLWEQLQRQVNLSKLYQQQTVILTERVDQLSMELGQLKTERKEDRFVLITVKVLTEGAVASKWADPDHIRDVKRACLKYEYIVADLKKKEPLVCWQMVMAMCMGSGLDPNYYSDEIDRNGKYDWGVADLNDVCLKAIEKELPDHLKNASWFNIEKSIAGRYVWLNQRYRMKMPLTSDVGYFQWKYFAMIKDS